MTTDEARAAFPRLVAEHQQALRAFLRRICGNCAQADDLAQETFVTAWSRLDRLGADANVRAWLCGIGYRKHLTAQRSERRSREREHAYTCDQPTPSALAAEERMALEAALAELPLEQRAAVALCLSGEFSHADAAQALGLPIGTVKSHVARGRARLLQALGASE